MKHEIVILGGARTPMAEWIGGKTGGGQRGGALAHLATDELGAIATKEALKRAAIKPEQVDHVIMGNAMQTSANGIYTARHMALKAGLPVTTPALSVNRLCGSGIQALISGAQLILLDEANIVVAGGMENMSQTPFVVRGAREGLRFGGGALEDYLVSSLTDAYCGCPMAQTSDNLSRKYGISREEQDAYACRSHQAGAEAIAAGRLAPEIIAIEVADRKGKVTLIDTDDHVVADTTVEKLARLRPAFGTDSMVTAGNASGLVDGAGTLVLTSRSHAEAIGRKPIGSLISWGVVGVDPLIMGIGPAPAIRAALTRAGLALDAIDLFEINEAFAGQYLAVEKELGLDRDKVNVNGGAIALGHPLGATGARLVLTLLYELRRRGKRYGAAAACIGGGQGIAMIVEVEQA